MSAPVAPPGWYPDPQGSGGQRYFDGFAWTEHSTVALPAFPAQQSQYWGTWKGARLGRPGHGPGSLADPWRRLAARVLDGLVLFPLLGGLVVLAVVLVAPHAGPMFPQVSTDPYGNTFYDTSSNQVPGFVWVELAILAAVFVYLLLVVVYEAVATARYGRTLGKSWMRIRPLQSNGATIGSGRATGRAAMYFVFSLISVAGLLDILWCLWDEDRQCLHDKVASTIVVSDV